MTRTIESRVFVDAVASLSAAFAAEAAETDPEAAIASALWPTAGALIDHLGQIQRWAAQVVRGGASVDRAALARPDGADRVEWYRRSAELIVDALRETDPARACWTLTGAGHAAFWRRRMAHEARKHLWDLRSATTALPPLPDQGGAAVQADVLDELFEVFLPRTLRTGQLRPLPGAVLLSADDTGDAWRIAADWSVRPDPAGAAATVSGALGDVVLFAWERMPLGPDGRLDVAGDPAIAEAFAAAHVHP